MTSQTAHAIALQGLVKSFRGHGGPVRAVRAVDLVVERGETVALLGPNGAGTSTTLDMLLGLTEPDPQGRSATASASGRRRPVRNGSSSRV